LDRHLLMTSETTEPSGSSWWSRDLVRLASDNDAAGCGRSQDRVASYTDAFTDRLLAMMVLARFSDEGTCQFSWPGEEGESYSFGVSCPRGRPKVHVRHRFEGAEQNFSFVFPVAEGHECPRSVARSCHREIIWRAFFSPWARFMVFRSPQLSGVVRAMCGLLPLAPEAPGAPATLERIRQVQAVLEEAGSGSLDAIDAFPCSEQNPVCLFMRVRAERLVEEGWLDASLESAAAVALLFDAVRTAGDLEAPLPGPAEPQAGELPQAAADGGARAFVPHAPAALAELGV